MNVGYTKTKGGEDKYKETYPFPQTLLLVGGREKIRADF
jgi:hypothetical protein